MLFNILKLIRNFLFVSVPDKYKKEFLTSINEINVNRAKITSITFIVLEVMQFLLWGIMKKGSLLKKPNIYYGAMYILLLLTMIVYLLVFLKLATNISKHETSIWFAGISFITSILLWCAGISLLDQLSSGQIIVYTVAIIAIAVTPFFEPLTLLLIYLSIQALFIFLLPHFQKSIGILFGNYINSTTFIIISWAISCMRYKNQVAVFNNRKLIQHNSDELERMNKELAEANQKLEKLSQTDSLTGIFNRFVFDTKLKDEWDRCKRNFVQLSLIMIDIDFFKAFNDHYGHQAGDDCLKRVSLALSSCAKRSSDIVARYGGEEFAVILTYMNKESVLEFAENLKENVERLAIPHMYSSISEHITISLGVHTVIPSNASSIEEFIGTADKALYEAKKARNNIVVA